MKKLKNLFKGLFSKTYTAEDVFTYKPFYYKDINGEPTFIKTNGIKRLKSFRIKAHDLATADNRAYDYIEIKYPDIKKYILFK